MLVKHIRAKLIYLLLNFFVFACLLTYLLVYVCVCVFKSFSMLYFQSASPVVDGLDPEGYIMYRLFRDATKYEKGTHQKVL